MSFLFEELTPFSHHGPHRCRRRPRPYPSLVDTLEDQMDQQVGYIFRHLPSMLLDAEELGPLAKRRKMDRKLLSAEPKSKALVSMQDGKFQVQVDTSSFSPDNISVKVVGDKIGVSAKHESKSDDTYEFHEMYRSFNIPEGIDPDAITSRLSTNGQLTIEAPLKALKDTPAERTVHIEMEKDKAIEKESPKKTDENK